jgi:hypothetical protein
MHKSWYPIPSSGMHKSSSGMHKLWYPIPSSGMHKSWYPIPSSGMHKSSSGMHKYQVACINHGIQFQSNDCRPPLVTC